MSGTRIPKPASRSPLTYLLKGARVATVALRDFDADRERAIREAIARFEDIGAPVPKHLQNLLRKPRTPKPAEPKQNPEQGPEPLEHKAETPAPEQSVPEKPKPPVPTKSHVARRRPATDH